MLARSFLTPAELNISDKEFNALVQVLGMLERGELPWHKKDEIRTGPSFDMRKWSCYGSKPFHCSTVGCIGFWVEKVMDAPVWLTEETINLFHIMELPKFDWSKIGPEHAALALRNYLGTGKADWASVLAQ